MFSNIVNDESDFFLDLANKANTENVYSKNTDTCETCKYFNRLRWNKAIDINEELQDGGTCNVLLNILQLTNGKLWSIEDIHIQKSFGCNAYTKK